ncbi:MULTISPECIES: LysR family transcriptional regulator [Sphingobium]|uniref:LysR-family transcriptional regulator n=1 Tax=Sphingobium indicum (strain DSM 16413 / CCM 7287 / MTCC 6362 / UT26 / NBRC 101211 / UT26S) TaxID=452662 RepID=D4Z2W6_SPHIU|nr:LysR family transcriptional regulator [Sphingobium indicum]BAI96948.1 LysR-family transcriptional regulator [Sphingobium indicum UT26S]
MEFRQLRYFVAAAEYGNIGTAAQRLNVSQPPVSRQIQALEDELGVQLLVRTTKGVSLTAAGRSFLEDARVILTRSRDSRDRCRAAGRGDVGRLAIGYLGSVIYQVLPALLRDFRREVPEADISLAQLSKHDMVQALRDGVIHVGFGRYFPGEPDIIFEKIQDEPLYVATADERAGAPDRPVALASYKDRPFVLFPKGDRPSFADEIIALLKARGIQPRIEHFAEDATAALALTAMGAGVCVVPASLAAIHWPGVRFTPLLDDAVGSPIVCAYAQHCDEPILHRFLGAIRR